MTGSSPARTEPDPLVVWGFYSRVHRAPEGRRDGR